MLVIISYFVKDELIYDYYSNIDILFFRVETYIPYLRAFTSDGQQISDTT